MRWILSAALAVGCVSISMAQELTGLKVGAKAPDFELQDQNGKERTLAEFTKKGPVAIVFHRSASW